MTNLKKLTVLVFILTIGFTSCRKNSTVPKAKKSVHSSQGLYILCQGTFGSSNAALDYYDFEKDTMYLDVFNKANPEVVKGLGDVGNDIGIYGSKMYLVINNSNKIEIVDAQSVKRIKKIDFSQGRYITFYGGKAYATSSKGYVAVIDTASFRVTDTIYVGSNPEQLAVVGHKLYVANSGGFNFPNYDSTVSVIDLNTQKEIKKIDVGINVNNIVANDNGKLYAISKGNYENIPANLYSIDTRADTVSKTFHIEVSNMAINGDKLYGYQYAYNANSGEYDKGYVLIDTSTDEMISHHFINDSIEQQISIPFGIAIRPENGDIFLSASKDFSSPGKLYVFDPKGNLQWVVKTNVNPSAFAFLRD